jgi:hypothetical protein
LDLFSLNNFFLDRSVLDGSVLDRVVLDGSVLDGSVLDGSVLDRSVPDRSILDRLLFIWVGIRIPGTFWGRALCHLVASRPWLRAAHHSQSKPTWYSGIGSISTNGSMKNSTKPIEVVLLRVGHVCLSVVVLEGSELKRMRKEMKLEF